MLAFALRRTLQSFPTVAAVALVVFVLFSVIPGSIATSMSDDGRGDDGRRGGRADAQGTRARRSRFTCGSRHYVEKLAVLDLGVSFRSREPVAQLLAQAPVADHATGARIDGASPC